MHILIISQHFYPENFRINDICARLVRDGNKVFVLTGRPDYPNGKIYPGYHRCPPFENLFGATVVRVKTMARGGSWISRICNYVSFAMKGRRKLKKIKREHFDYIFCFQTSPVTQLIPAVEAKKIFSAPLIAYCCDLWPESVKAAGPIGFLFYKPVARLSKNLYQKCDYLINCSPSFLAYNHSINKVPFERMSFLLQHYQDFSIPIETFQKKENKYCDILFAGNVGKVQNIVDVIRAVSILNNTSVRIHIVGNGSSLGGCKTLISRLHLEKRVICYGLRPKSEMPFFYRMCDACLLPLSGRTTIGLTLPSKLTEYLAAGKPIIGYIGGDAEELIKREQLGICCEPDNFQKLAETIDFFVDHFSSFSGCGERGRAFYLKNGTLDVWMRSFYSLLDTFE